MKENLQGVREFEPGGLQRGQSFYRRGEEFGEVLRRVHLWFVRYNPMNPYVNPISEYLPEYTS